jgi:hypothetical protein
MTAKADAARSWRTSSRSYGSGACVEVAGPSPDHIRVRDSENRQGPTLQVTQKAWTTFLGHVRSGRLPQKPLSLHGTR